MWLLKTSLGETLEENRFQKRGLKAKGGKSKINR